MLGKSEVYQSTGPVRVEDRTQPLKSAVRLRFADERRLHEVCEAMMANARDVPLFALAAFHWHLPHLPASTLALHLSMSC